MTNTLSVYASVVTTDSAPITKTLYGYTYSFYARAANDGDKSWGYSDISSASSIPAGYMGAISQLWKHTSSGDILKASGSEIYNSANSKGVVSCTSIYTGSGYYYSQGIVYIYDGTRYIPYTNNPTAYLYASSSASSSGLNNLNSNGFSSSIYNLKSLYDFSISSNQIKPYQKNKYGESYGYAGHNADLIGKQPDLIAAYSTDDKFGYVRAKDLESAKPKTPEEAITITLQNLKGKIINVYDKDGRTVIGTFEIKPGPYTLYK